jgi:endonuclease G
MSLNESIVEQTEKRYLERNSDREKNIEKIEKAKQKEGSLLEVDTPERVEKRLKRLARAQLNTAVYSSKENEAVASNPREAVAADMGVALERILGKSDLMSITYLELGLLVSRFVGRVRIRAAGGQTLGFGTCFMVSPRLLLTNNHVLRNAREAQLSLVEFNFQEQLDGKAAPMAAFNLDSEAFFLTDMHLDYSLVAVKELSLERASLQTFCWSRLLEEEGKVILGEEVNIIQHPNGEPKQIALRENQLIDLLPDFLHYKTDTAPGSSGSPVYNDQWEVIGLHHSGVPKRDAQGNILTRDGTIWIPAMGEHRIDWIANEGVRISQIVKHIKAQNLSEGQRRFRSDMFEKEPPLHNNPVERIVEKTVAPSPLDGQGHTASSPVINSNGVAVWTIPLQISVQLGNPVASPSTLPVINDVKLDGSPGQGGKGLGTTNVSGNKLDSSSDNKEFNDAIAELREANTKPYYSAATDNADRDAYYANVPGNLSKAAFFDHLSDLLTSTHTTPLTYKPAVRLYTWVDLQPNLKLKSVYSGLEFEPENIIREDFRIDQERTMRLQELKLTESAMSAHRFTHELDLLEASLPYNCEHVVPQSWFNKKEPMRGDLHHLFACESDCNSFRGNIPYYDFDDFEEVVRNDCGKREGNKFEPGAGKGTVARAVLYFLLRYPGQINNTANEFEEERLNMIIAWHNNFPVTEHEKHRNMAIYKKQGNRNPLIDFPAWATKIDFRKGLG